MISCLNFGYLPPLECTPAPLSTTRDPTLTEVVCMAIFGAPLKPLRGEGTLADRLKPEEDESVALWQSKHGPFWLKPHLELIAVGNFYPGEPDPCHEMQQMYFREFAAAQAWLDVGRKLPAPEGALPTVVAKKKRLAAMNDAEAIQFVQNECARIERENGEVDRRAARFYELISEAVITGTVNLKAISFNPDTRQRLQRNPAKPLHCAIERNQFDLPLVHDVFNNEVYVDLVAFGRKNTGRPQRTEGAPAIRWEDVLVPLPQAKRLLAEFHRRKSSSASEVQAIDGQPQHDEPMLNRAAVVGREWSGALNAPSRSGGVEPASPAAVVPKKKSSGGRRQGSGSLAPMDEPLNEEMHALLTSQPPKAASLHAAAKMVADRAHGGATFESKVRRLKIHYTEKYPLDSNPNKSD